MTEQRRDVEEDLQAKRAALQGTRQALDRIRSEFSRVKARKDSLEEVISHRSYTTETVKRLFTAIAKGQANDLKPVGVLADFVEVDPQHERATEEFLHEELEYVVVRDWAEAERGIDLLRSGLDGRATFLVEQFGEGEAARAEAPEVSAETGVLVRLGDTLRFTNGLTGAPLELLPRVANCYLTHDREAAQALAPKYPNCWFLAPDGVSYHGQAISGGKKTGAGPLALKRELREVSQLEQTKQAELNTAQTQLTDLEREIATLTEHLEHLRQRSRFRRRTRWRLITRPASWRKNFNGRQSRLSAARLELERVQRDRIRLEEGLAQTRSQLVEKENAREAQEDPLERRRGKSFMICRPRSPE